MSAPFDQTKLSTCGCCDGDLEAPAHYNPPGLPEIDYRIDTHAGFLARMKARIHAWEILTCAKCDERFAGPDRLDMILDHIARAHPAEPNPADLVVAERPLAGLGTREPTDPAIAMMDAWSVVGDVITFYQERIANENYLRTATERRSILELARAIGYELDPGVAAETYIAFLVDDAEGAPTESDVPAGTQLLSIPASKDEVPQTFETAEDLTAHVGWNALRPCLEHPLSLAAGLSHVFLSGTATGVVAGSLILLLIDDVPTVKRVARVRTFRDKGYTRADFTAGDTAPPTVTDTLPTGGLDPNQEALPLTRENVESFVVEQTWAEDDLQAFLSIHEWSSDAAIAYVDDIRAAQFNGEGQQFINLREKVAFFGHNAPYFDSLPEIEVGTNGSTEKAWPENWDNIGFSIWEDSLTADYYYDEENDEYFDVYLERIVSELVGDSWAVFERPLNEFYACQVLDAAEASRTGFGISAKVSGLKLAGIDGSHLENDDDDKPPEFHFRRSTAHVRSEVLPLAGVPLTDDLAQGTTEIRLGTMVLGLHAGQVVALEGEEVGSDGSIRRELLTLDAVTHSGGYTTLTFEGAGLMRSYVRASVAINANVVRASHGETVSGEVLGSGNGAAKHQRFTLKKPPLTYLSAVGGSESELTVRVNGVEWEHVDSLYGLDGSTRAYVVRIDDDANATVVFGDGKSGARLPTGQENVTASYRSGIGSEGEVGAGTLTLLKTRPFGIRSVTNPLPASGADDPEVLADARTNAPLTVLTLDRIVSLQDYEDYARAYPGIGKARADVVWNGQGEIIHLTVADANGDAVVDPLYGRLLESIEDARDPLRPVEMDSFDPFVFFVTAKVLIDDAFLWDNVEPALRGALAAAFSFERRAFGQPVSAAEVLQVMHGVSGVLAVDLDELYKTAPDAAPSGNLYNTILDARAARFDAESNDTLPAELLLIHPFGIHLSQMKP